MLSRHYQFRDPGFAVSRSIPVNRAISLFDVLRENLLTLKHKDMQKKLVYYHLFN